MRFFILACCVVGCVSVPNEDLAQLTPSISLEACRETSLEYPEFTEGDWPSDQWWEMFEDDQLNQLMDAALENSPTLKETKSRVQYAEQMAFKERSRLFPHLDLNANENWQYFSPNGFVRSFYPEMPGIAVPATVNQIDLSLNFSYEFDFWGKNRKKFQAALGLMRAAEAENAQAKLILTTYLAQSYFELQAHLREKAVLERKLRERRDLNTLGRARSRFGLDNELFPLSLSKNLLAAEQLLAAVKRQIAFDRNRIKMLIGKGPDSPNLQNSLAADFDGPFALPGELSVDLLARRPDLQALIWRVESAAKEIGIAKADFYPNINLSAFAGLESLAFRDLFKWSSRTGALEPAIHLPIFTAGRLRANLRSKVAAYNEMVFSYNDLLLHAAKEVADQLVQLKTKYEEFELQKGIVQRSRHQYNLMNLRCQHGVSNSLNVLNQEEDLLSEELLLIFSHRDYLLSILQLIKAFGGGYHE